MPIVARVNPEIANRIDGAPQVRNSTTVRPAQGLSEVAGQFAGIAEKHYQQAADKADVASYMEAQRKLSDWENGWNDPNNEAGIQSYKGREALKLGDVILPDFDRATSEIAASLPSDRAREKFAQYAAQQRDRTWNQTNRYAVAQNEAYIAGERQVYAATQTDALIRAQITDPNQYQQLWATTLDTIYADTAANGGSPKVAEARIQAMQSGVHTGVMDNLTATNNVLAARDYYDEHADQFNEDDRAKVLRVLQPLVDDAQADEDAAAVIAGGPLPAEYQPPARGKPAGNVKAIIEQAAKSHGVPPEYLLALAEQESGFDPKARNEEALDDGDHAEGLFQYRRSTSAALGGFDRSDPVASANAAAREFRVRMDQHGPDFAIAAHFAGDGGAEAVVQRGRTGENPKTARYLDEVRGRAARWRGENGPAMGAVDTPAQRTTATSEAPSLADALERVQALPLHRRAKAEAKVRDQFQVQKLRETEEQRVFNEGVNAAVWEADPNTSLRDILGPERYARAAREGDLGRLSGELKFRRDGDPTRTDNAAVVGPYLDALRDRPKAFADMDVMRNARHMSPETAKELVKLQEQVRAGKFDAADYATESEQLKALVYAPLGAVGESKPAKDKRAKFEAAWFAAKRDHTSRTGKQPTAEEREGLIRKLTATFVLNGEDVPLYQAGAAGKVPDADRALITAAYANKGLPAPDEATVRRLYLLNASH